MADRCETCNAVTNYQGYPNYPTWAVALWIDNDQGTQEWVHDGVIKTLDHWEKRGDEELWSVRVEVEHWLRETLERDLQLIPDLGASMASDLLTWAVDSVDWHELAEHYIESVKEQRAHEALAAETTWQRPLAEHAAEYDDQTA